jgi:hypothetical protein
VWCGVVIEFYSLPVQRSVIWWIAPLLPPYVRLFFPLHKSHHLNSFPPFRTSPFSLPPSTSLPSPLFLPQLKKAKQSEAVEMAAALEAAGVATASALRRAELEEETDGMLESLINR